MRHQLQQLLASVAISGLGVGCASAAPTQLVEAREAYIRSGLTSGSAPTEFAVGKKMLDRANAEFEARGDAQPARAFAYLAERRFQLTDGVAQTEVDRRRSAEAVAPGVRVWAARSQLVSDRCVHDDGMMVIQEARAQVQALAQAVAQVAVEREGRVAAEAQLAAAMVDRAFVADARVDGWQ